MGHKVWARKGKRGRPGGRCMTKGSVGSRRGANERGRVGEITLSAVSCEDSLPSRIGSPASPFYLSRRLPTRLEPSGLTLRPATSTGVRRRCRCSTCLRCPAPGRCCPPPSRPLSVPCGLFKDTSAHYHMLIRQNKKDKKEKQT